MGVSGRIDEILVCGGVGGCFVPLLDHLQAMVEVRDVPGGLFFTIFHCFLSNNHTNFNLFSDFLKW